MVPMISGSVPEWMESFPPESMTSLQNSMVGWYEWSVWVVACSHTRFVNRWTSDSVSVGGGSGSCQVFYRAWDDDPPSSAGDEPVLVCHWALIGGSW